MCVGRTLQAPNREPVQMPRRPTYRPSIRQYRQVLSALKDAQETMRDVADRIDVTTVGRAKWRLTLAADRAANVIRSVDQE